MVFKIIEAEEPELYIKVILFVGLDAIPSM